VTVSAPVLWLGFLLGLRHALEADHVSAVASLGTGSARAAGALRVAAAWGLGHAVVLAFAGALMVAAGAVLPPTVARACEAAAALALLWIGIGGIARALGAGSSEGHVHAPPPVGRALVIGGLHGLEGSGAAVLVALPSVHSPAHALGYLALFGAGALTGMLGCSLALSVPLEATRRTSRRAARALELGAGVASLLVALGYIRSILT
jgi:high-affinity nickel-transport protein